MKKRVDLKELLGKPTKLYEKFHEATKIKNFEPEIPKDLWPENWKKINYKGYPRLEEVKLPAPSLPETLAFKKVLKKRVSRRIFSDKPVSVGDLSSLLYYSAGERVKDNKKESRYYPSSGGRYPLEIYIVLRNSDINSGIYHYYVRNNSLERIRDFEEKSFNKITNQKWAQKAQCLVFITAVFARNTAKYGDRGYRHVMMEAGCLLQNFYLVSSALNLICCANGGYIDDEINKILDIDGMRESVVGFLAIGR